jgi:hypothetical protein
MAAPLPSRHLLSLGLALTGLSGLTGEAAWLHMRTLGTICGAAAAPHCAICPLSVALLAAGLASLAAAAAPRRAVAATGRCTQC